MAQSTSWAEGVKFQKRLHFQLRGSKLTLLSLVATVTCLYIFTVIVGQCKECNGTIDELGRRSEISEEVAFSVAGVQIDSSLSCCNGDLPLYFYNSRGTMQGMQWHNRRVGPKE